MYLPSDYIYPYRVSARAARNGAPEAGSVATTAPADA